MSRRTRRSAAFCHRGPIHVSSLSTFHRRLHTSANSPDARALVRLQADHVNRTLVPAFYRYLQAQDADAQIKGGQEFLEAIRGLTDLFERMEREIVAPGGASGEGEARALKAGLGLWVEGGDLGYVDAMAGPCECLGER